MARDVGPRLRLWAAGAAVLAVLALAASSGPVRLWTNPEVTGAASPPTVAEGTLTSQPQLTTDTRPPPRIDGWLNTMAGAVILIVVASGVVLAIGGLGARPMAMPRRGRQRRRSAEVDQVAEPTASPLRVDANAAHAALSRGTPRHAIVACWTQLQRDAAAVGVERLSAETAAEYVERVVVASSVERAPIAALAALYREARFSDHELDDGHRARAVLALDDVVAGLTASSVSA